MPSTKSQHLKSKQVESMHLDPSSPPVPMEPPPSYSSVPDFNKDHPIPADRVPLVQSADDCQEKRHVEFPDASSSPQNNEYQPIIKQPEMNSEKCVQSQNSKSKRARNRDDDDNCCISICNLCCMETCSCMVMCLEAFTTSLQYLVACFMCTEFCQ